ncbi:MAG TPA: hypothetical protein P5277_02460 [Candidatus Paceibacterota bacterium]|nr:hypothetical protein [Candidatus Paceibacterota bacterium]
MKFKIIKQKKGQEHIEIVIASVIFIGFLSIMFIFFSPFKSPKNEEITKTVQINLEEKLKTNLYSISLVAYSKDNTKSCLTLKETASIIEDIHCNEPNNKILVKKEDGTSINSVKDSNSITIEKGSSTFYTIYCNKDLTEKTTTLIDCEPLDKYSGYNLSIVSERDVWSTQTLEKLRDDYKNDYETLKKDLMPQGIDFSFLVNDEVGTLLYSGDKDAPRGVNVYSEITPIEIMDKDAVIKQGTITVVTW